MICWRWTLVLDGLLSQYAQVLLLLPFWLAGVQRQHMHKMMDWLKPAIAHDNEDIERDKHIFHREEVLDIMQKEIVEFLGHVLSGNVPQETMLEARKQLRIADEYEYLYLDNLQFSRCGGSCALPAPAGAEYCWVLCRSATNLKDQS